MPCRCQTPARWADLFRLEPPAASPPVRLRDPCSSTSATARRMATDARQLAALLDAVFAQGPAQSRPGILRPRPPWLPHPRRRLPRLRGGGAGLEALAGMGCLTRWGIVPAWAGRYAGPLHQARRCCPCARVGRTRGWAQSAEHEPLPLCPRGPDT